VQADKVTNVSGPIESRKLPTGPNPRQRSESCPRLPQISFLFLPITTIRPATWPYELGTLKAEITTLEDHEKALLRDELIRRGGAEIAGAFYCATISDAVRWTLDAKGVKAEMGDAWWNARCRQSLVTSVSVKALPASPKLAAQGGWINVRPEIPRPSHRRHLPGDPRRQ